MTGKSRKISAVKRTVVKLSRTIYKAEFRRIFLHNV